VTYYLRSSVLGSTIAKLDVNGQRIESYVYAGGRKLATADSYSGGVTWSHTDPVIGSHGVSFPAGGYGPDREFNADGIDVGLDAPQPESEVPDTEFVKLTRPSGCGMLDLTCQSCAFGGSSLTCAEVSQLQRVYGERFFDLPGVDNEMARAEGLYLGRVHSAFDTYNYNQTHKTKPVLKEPKLTKAEADRLNRENAGVGNDESRTGGTSIQILDPFEFVLQQPAEGSFLDCVGKAGLRGTNFNEDAADLINKLNQVEGTSRELLAVTMMNEGKPSFDVLSQPNTADNSPNPYAWDYGPFQLNAHQTFADILFGGSYNIHGINLDRAFGNFNGAAGQRFNGDPVENGRIASRKLNALVSKYGEEKAAGLYTGGTRVAKRMQSYRDYAGKFRDFFKCYRKPQ